MSTPARVSPLTDAQSTQAARWIELEQMRVVAAFQQERSTALETIAIADLSFLRRTGVKGPGAAAALKSLGIDTPAQPNQWCLSQGALVARLGLTEYLIEQETADQVVTRVLTLSPAADVYPVPHFDAALIVIGPQAIDLFRQTCSVDAATIDPNQGGLVLTSMVGVGATVAAMNTSAGVAYRIWFDGTYGSYMWETLCEIAHDMGGGPIGNEMLSKVLR